MGNSPSSCNSKKKRIKNIKKRGSVLEIQENKNEKNNNKKRHKKKIFNFFQKTSNDNLPQTSPTLSSYFDSHEGPLDEIIIRNFDYFEKIKNNKNEKKLIKVAVGTMQGWRRRMEDRFLVQMGVRYIDDCLVVGVFDGHGGFEAAEEASTVLITHLRDIIIENEEEAKKIVNENKRRRSEKMEQIQLKKKQEMDNQSNDDDDKIIENENKKNDTRESDEKDRKDIKKKDIKKEIKNDDKDINESDDKVNKTNENDKNMKEMDNKDNIYNENEKNMKEIENTNKNGEIKKKNSHFRLSHFLRMPQIEECLVNSFLKTDETLREHNTPAGTTAILAVITKNEIVVANCGDSRAVLCSNNKQVGLSKDHKPTIGAERRRIMRAGGTIDDRDPKHPRIFNPMNPYVCLNLSRTLGDFEFKSAPHKSPKQQIISPLPDIIWKPRLSEHQILILASDGVWDILSNQDMITLILKTQKKLRKTGKDPHDLNFITEAILRFCFQNGTTDNMTLILVDFNGPNMTHDEIEMYIKEREEEMKKSKHLHLEKINVSLENEEKK